MAYPKKTFGQHIEDGLTFMGDGIYNAVKESKDHELECIKTGYIDDTEKLKMLKRDLYEAARSRANPEHIQNLKQAINIISQQLENERTYRNSLGYQISGVINSIILLAILVTGFSFPMAWSCGLNNSQSQACQVSRIIPMATLKFFSEPISNSK